MPTVQELQDSLQKTLNDFRVTNDAALAEAKEHGKTSAALAEKVDKLNASFEKEKETLKEELKKLSNNISDRMAALSVGGAGGTDAKAKKKTLRAFRAATKNKDISADQLDKYNDVFVDYIRSGGRPLPLEIQNAMSVGYEQGGGYWVPPDTSGPMVKKLYETSPMRQLATVQTISTDALEGWVDNDEADSGWVAEQADRPETKSPEVGKYRIPVFEQYANPRITQQLLDDSEYDVESWLRDKVANKLARKENAAFINGNGSGKPRGLLNYSIVTTADATRKWDQMQYIPSGAAGGFANTNPADPILDLIYSLKQGYRAGSSFLAARQTLGTVRKLKDGQGNYLSGVTFANGAFNETLFGFPVADGEDMPAIAANSFSLAFGNFKEAYIIVDRQGIRVLPDPYTKKPFVQFYTTKRVGGGLVNGEAVKWLKFAVS